MEKVTVHTYGIKTSMLAGMCGERLKLWNRVLCVCMHVRACTCANVSHVTSAAGLREPQREMRSHRVDNSTAVVPFLLSITYPTHTHKTHTRTHRALQSAPHPCHFIIARMHSSSYTHVTGAKIINLCKYALLHIFMLKWNVQLLARLPSIPQ